MSYYDNLKLPEQVTPGTKSLSTFNADGSIRQTGYYDAVGRLQTTATYGQGGATTYTNYPVNTQPYLSDANLLGPQSITSNKGNTYNNIPAGNHTYSINNPGLKGAPNSSVDMIGKSGEIITRRWYDSNGIAVRDIDYNNHGNPKTHPEWPHEHNFEYNTDGSFKSR